MEVVFTINGNEYRVKQNEVPISTSLNTYIRNNAQLRGTKFMCSEGGCGACDVTVRGVHPVTNETKSWGVTSCLLPVFSCHGLEITTIEGLGQYATGYDKIQTRLVAFNGIQCGYCTPGMVMNMHGLMEAKDGNVTVQDVENSFGGNICRCTGYRPILDAFKSLAIDASPKLLEACKDIEDLNGKCPSTGKSCAGKCKITNVNKNVVELAFDGDRLWYKMYKISDILTLFSSIGTRSYILVGGNTAHGVYRHSNIEIFVDISSVIELRTNRIKSDQIELGGNVTLTEMMDIFEQATKGNPNFAYLQEVIKHIELVANLAIRNTGTLAGNLMIKNAHPAFPSDLFVILEVIGASIVLTNNAGVEKLCTPEEFLSINMRHQIITRILIPQLEPRFVYRSYKIMPKAQNSHAYVNAAFIMEFNEARTTVVSARICYGGINATFNRATATEKFLRGKDLYTTTTLQAAIQVLDSELNPDWVLPDASPEYRKGLAMSLFYKYILGTCPEDRVHPKFRSGGDILERGISSGEQVFQTDETKYPMTQAVTRVDGFVQVGGETQFSNDYPKLSGELWGAFVHATKVHATITGFDASDALKMPGVVAFYSAKDVPGVNSFVSTALPGIIELEELFCSGKVIYNGQVAGIIFAEDRGMAIAASYRVRINYACEVSDPILPTMNDVFNANATNRIHRRPEFDHKATKYGTEMSKNITGRFEVGSQFHLYMEPQTCVAVPSENGLNVYSSTQWMHHAQVVISKCVKLPENRINMETRRLGGGFGGKQSRSLPAACGAALGAVLTNRPCRVVMTMTSTMNALGKRFPCIGEYQVDVNDEGKIQKLKKTYYVDHGHSFNDVFEMLVTGWLLNCYETSAFDIVANAIKTDSPSNTYARGPGTCEGMAMIENIMEHIAYVTGKDAVSVRLQNIADDNPVKKMIPDFVISSDYYKRKADIDAFNLNNRWTKRGIGFIAMQYVQNFFGHFSALVSIYHVDGTVAISHGGIEMGQGVTTKVCQVAAATLGIPLEYVSVKASNNLISPNSAVSGGSIVSDSASVAVLKACQELNARIKPIRETMPNSTWQEILYACNEKHVNLSALHLQSENDMKQYAVPGVACSEVEVDILSGNFILRRVDILEDVGLSYSPLMDVGQVEGGFIMGIGFWLSEKLLYGPDGGLLTNRTWNYAPPGPKDIPVDFRVTFLKNSGNEKSLFSSKIVGEPPICLSAVVIFALRHALMSARRDAGMIEPWYDIKAPYTVENIYLTAGTECNKFEL